MPARTHLLNVMIVLFAGALLQGCTLLDRIASGLSEVCETEIYTVTKFEDTDDGICTADDCSLREAVLTANACEGDHTIRVPEGTYNLSRIGANEDDSHRGDLDIRRPMTIEATGGEVIIDGQHEDRIFDVFVPADIPGGVTLEGLILQNGAVDGRGGGVLLQQGVLNITFGTLRANTAGAAGSSGGAGGAIYVRGRLSLIDEVITNNTAYGEGGGIFVDTAGRLSVVVDMSLTNNHARDNYGGGGLYNRGEAEVLGEIRGNTADWSGGGISNHGELVVHDAEISGNTSMVLGGGIVTTRSMELRDSVVQGNRAPLGGGLYSAPVPRAPEPVVRVSGTIFELNDVTEHGGGIYNSRGARLAIWGSWIRNNRAQYGAGIYNLGDLALSSSTLSRNQASFTVGGGGLFNELEGYALVENVTVSGNTAPNGAGIFNGGGVIRGGLDLMYSTITNNTGGGLFTFDGASSTVSNTVLSGNTRDNCRNQNPTSSGGNLEQGVSCGFDAGAGDLPMGDPFLLPLSDNGGFAYTHALQSGSPAVDAASGACPSGDQRGVARPQGAACDVGAYEFEAGETADSSPAGATPTPSSEVVSPSSPIEINFNADAYSLPLGECTRLRWAVENADLVMLGEETVPATEAEQVCPLGTTTYQLTASNASESAEAFVTIEVLAPVVEPPSAPAQLGASEQQCSDNSYVVSLNWVDTANNEDGYRVYRDGNLIATLGPNVNKYTDNGAPASGSPVTYGVEAFNDAGASSRPTAQEDGCLF